jgi:hypothetical protein
MIALAAIAFALLICAWFFGPNTEVQTKTEVAPILVVGEAAA